MSVSRREFLKFGATALAFGTFGGRRLFALPPGWKPGTRPRLVFGVMSDTHLRTHYDGVSFYSHYDTAMDDQAVVALLEYFKRQGADAVVHCGDLTDRGMTRTMELYKANEPLTGSPFSVPVYVTLSPSPSARPEPWMRRFCAP